MNHRRMIVKPGALYPNRVALRRMLLVGFLAVVVLSGVGCGAFNQPMNDPASSAEVELNTAEGLAQLAFNKYEKANFAEADSLAELALGLSPKLGSALYVKALLMEENGDWQDAAAVYTDYADYSSMSDDLMAEMRARHSFASNRLLRLEVIAEIAEPDRDFETDVLVVHRFIPTSSSRRDSAMALGVTDFLTNSFAMVGGVQVIDQSRRQMLDEEIRRSQSAAFAADAGLVEKKIGAGLAIRGFAGVAAGEKGQTAVGFSLIDHLSSEDNPEYRGTPQDIQFTTANRHILQDLGKQVVALCENQLNLDLDPDLKAQLEQPPTNSFEAFMAYSEGLLWEDQGQFSNAYDSYSAASQMDPGFVKASSSTGRVSGIGDFGKAEFPDHSGMVSNQGLEDFAIRAMTSAAYGVDEIPMESTEDPVQTTIVHTTVRIVVNSQ